MKHFAFFVRARKARLVAVKLFAEVIGRMDERGAVIVYSLERFLMGVHHVARLIVALVNMVLEPLRDLQVVHLVALVIRCGQVEVTVR